MMVDVRSLASQFSPDDVESAIGEIQQVRRQIKNVQPVASLRCAGLLTTLSHNEPTFLKLPEDVRSALHDVICNSPTPTPRRRNDRHTCQVVQKLAKDLQRLKQLKPARLIEMQGLCTHMHALLPRILPCSIEQLLAA